MGLYRASYPFQFNLIDRPLCEIISPPDKEIKSLIELVDSNLEETEGEKSGFLLYNNKTVCADEFTISASDGMCRLLGYLNSQRWKARESNKTYEINSGTLICGGQNLVNPCNFQHMRECGTSNVAFLYCTGLMISLVSTLELSISISIFFVIGVMIANQDHKI